MAFIQRDEIQLMILASRLYYEEGITQEDIARTMGISRPTVSRLLQRARESGIVQINIVEPFAIDEQLASEIVAAFGLHAAIFVPGIPKRPDLSQKWLGLAAARFLENEIQSNEIIGVGWGRTLYAVSQSLTPIPKQDLLVVPLLGGLGQISPDFQVHEIARAIAEAFGGEWKQIYIPALVEDENLRLSLLQSKDLQELTAIWNSMTTALVGIGNVDFDAEMQMLFARYLDEKTRARLARGGAVGDICMRFFDIEGHPVDGLVGLTGIELEQLRSIKRVIAVAGGVHKAEAILGALQGKFIHVLITTDLTARKILSISRSLK